MMDNVSTADLLAMRDNNGMNGFGNGGGDFLLLVLFLFMFGQNGLGFGNRGFGDAATAAAQNEILSGQQFDRVGQKLDAIGQGICDSTYSLNNSIKDCCCANQLMGRDIMAGIHAEGEATRALIRDNEIQALRDKVSDLQLRASQCDQNEYLVGKLRPCAVPAYLTCSPYQSYAGCGCYGNNYQQNI